jgi:phage shock protein A
LVERYENQISDARKDAEQLGMQLAQSETEKNLIQTSAAIKDQLNLGDLAVARRKVQDQINSNRGAAKATRDMNAVDSIAEEDAELEKSMAVSEILNRFKE